MDYFNEQLSVEAAKRTKKPIKGTEFMVKCGGSPKWRRVYLVNKHHVVEYEYNRIGLNMKDFNERLL